MHDSFLACVLKTNSLVCVFSEFSEVAVEIVNRENLLDMLVPCLNPEVYEYDIAIACGENFLQASRGGLLESCA